LSCQWMEVLPQRSIETLLILKELNVWMVIGSPNNL